MSLYNSQLNHPDYYKLGEEPYQEVQYLSELTEQSNYNTRLVYRTNVWDGVLSGVMLWNGEHCYFNAFDEFTIEYLYESEDESEKNFWADYLGKSVEELTDEDWLEYERLRIFNVYRMPKEIMDTAIHNIAHFRKRGDNNCYDEKGNRFFLSEQPKEIQDKHEKYINSKECKKFKYRNYNFSIEDGELIGRFKI